jgi:hypothetical protein
MTDLSQENSTKTKICFSFKTSIFQNEIDEKTLEVDLTEGDLNLLNKKELPENINSLINSMIYDLDGLSECDYQDDCGWVLLDIEKIIEDEIEEFGYSWTINSLIEFADELQEALEAWHSETISEDEIRRYIADIEEGSMTVDSVMKKFGHSLKNGAYYN